MTGIPQLLTCTATAVLAVCPWGSRAPGTDFPEQELVAEDPDEIPAPPLFLDTPVPTLRETYARMAAGSARNSRLYGELLLNGGDGGGYPYVARAAAGTDARAAYLVAESLAYGLWGQEKDYTLAMKWLHTAMSANYAPAYERMAALTWDGDWDCLRNTHDAIWYLDKAIALYMTDEVADARQREQLENYVHTLRRLRTSLNRVKDYNWERLGQYIPDLKGFTPSFAQMRLSTFTDTTDEGLRRRLTYIQAVMEQQRGKFKIDKLATVRPERLPISATLAPDGSEVAKTFWKASDSTFTARVELHMNTLPPASGMRDSDFEALRKDAIRLVIVNDALAHELSHVYFCSRYPKLADSSESDNRLTYEGHATNAAYEFTNTTFFQGSLSPERYADFFLSDEYREYFFWFRENCITPASRIDWETLDRWERNAGGSGYRPRTRKQDTSGAPAAPLLQFFGKAFSGYM